MVRSRDRDKLMSQTELQRLKVKAEQVHVAALNLADTYGIFHGINSARNMQRADTKTTAAIISIKTILLHLMVIRVCALFERGLRARPDDVSILILEMSITPEVQRDMITADVEWRRLIGPRAKKRNVATSIASLRRQAKRLRSHDGALKRIQHFRHKRLAHLTVSHDPKNQVVLRELWQLSLLALRAAGNVQLIFGLPGPNYMAEVKRAKARGKALAQAVVRK
jgi:hypothetical protein